MKKLYSYTGSILTDEKIAAFKWHGETFARSKKEAIRNLSYQFSMQRYGTKPNKKIYFPNSLNEEVSNYE